MARSKKVTFIQGQLFQLDLGDIPDFQLAVEFSGELAEYERLVGLRNFFRDQRCSDFYLYYDNLIKKYENEFYSERRSFFKKRTEG